MYVKDNQNQTGEMFPFIFEVVEKMGLSENANDSNFQQSSSISSETVEGEKMIMGVLYSKPWKVEERLTKEVHQVNLWILWMLEKTHKEVTQMNLWKVLRVVKGVPQVDLRKLVDTEISNQVLSNSVLSLFKQKDHKIQMRIRL
jgi:hypothetical protein